MNCKEWMMASSVLALVVGVGVGRAQQAVLPPPPPPTVLVAPPAAPPVPHCEVITLEAIGCKVCTPAVKAVQAKNKAGTSCAECAPCQSGECCPNCGTAKKDAFAGGCTGNSGHVKKAKKHKASGMKDQFFIAPPAPAMPVTVYTPVPMMPTPNNMAMPCPAPVAPPMVFRAVNHASTGVGVQQAKYETGTIALGVALDFGHAGAPAVKMTKVSALEIDCGAGCRATCQQMTLQVPGGKELVVAATGNQVVISGPSLKATCDNVTRCGSDGSLCLMLEGHVHLHHAANGMKAEIDSDQVRLLMHDGMVEVQTVTSH